MSRSAVRARLALAGGAVLIASTLWSLALFFTRTGTGNMTVSGARAFRYFTVDSNILAALSSAGVMAGAGRGLRRGTFALSRGAALFHYVGASAVGVTFAVVMAFLGPTMGYGKMFKGMNLFLHLINPLLAAALWLLPDRGDPLPRRAVLWGAAPVAAYGAVYVTMVLLVRRWPDFYGFNAGGLWYVSYPAVMIGGALVAWALRRARLAADKRKNGFLLL